jgi:hypothetical protein
MTNAPNAPQEALASWQIVWRKGFAPQLSTLGLQALRRALSEDDAGLIQGATTSPPPLHCCQDFLIEAACGIAYAGWKGEQLNTVGEVEEFFSRACYQADQLLGEPAGVRWFLNWFDETPRAQMRTLLIAEIDHELARREADRSGAA